MKNSYKILILSLFFSVALACSNTSSSDADDSFRNQGVDSSITQPADSSFNLTYNTVPYTQTATSKQYAIAYHDSSAGKVGLSCLQVDEYGKPFFKLIIHFDDSSMPTGAVTRFSNVILQVKDALDHNKAWKTYKTTATLDYTFPASIDRTTPATIQINTIINNLGGANININSTYTVLLGSLTN